MLRSILVDVVCGAAFKQDIVLIVWNMTDPLKFNFIARANRTGKFLASAERENKDVGVASLPACRR